MSEEKERIGEQDLYEQEFKPPRQPLGRKARLIVGISAAVLICVLGLAVHFLLQTSASAGLTVTVFSDNWAEAELKPGVETSLNEYLASGSDVPGYPLRVDDPAADKITLTVDAGSLFTWGSPDYVAKDRGTSYAVSPDDTVYWSPYQQDGSAVSQCTLTVSAAAGGMEAAAVRLIIRQTGETGYSITLLANE